MYHFNAVNVISDCTKWIRDLFEQKYQGKNAIILCEQGYNDVVCAALCKKALGDDRVLFAHVASDPENTEFKNKLEELCVRDVLIIKNPNVWNGEIITQDDIVKMLRKVSLFEAAKENNAVVCSTLNLTQRWIGGYTLFADDLALFAPIENLTDTEVRKVGECLGLTKKIIHNISEFYCEVDRYVRSNDLNLDEETREKINRRYNESKDKRKVVQVDSLFVSACDLYENPFN
jgi:NH3-dependent NAD+ synthetase